MDINTKIGFFFLSVMGLMSTTWCVHEYVVKKETTTSKSTPQTKAVTV